jgi:hypothetical protein
MLESAAFNDARSHLNSCTQTRHFNADPIDRTLVILHSSFHVLEAAQSFLAQPPKTWPAQRSAELAASTTAQSAVR